MSSAHTSSRSKSLFADETFLVLLAGIALWVAWMSYLSYGRWYVMLSSMGDLGLYDSAAYNTAYGAFMTTTSYRIENIWQEHFAPIILVLTGYYYFDDGFLFIYVWQSLSVALTTVPLYLIARDSLESRWAALLIGLAYLANGKLQMAALFDYHPSAHIGLFALSAFYAAMRHRWGYYFLFAALLLTCREDTAFILFTIGLYLAIFKKEWRWGSATCIVAVAYFIFLMKVSFPYFRDLSLEKMGTQAYYFTLSYAWLGETPVEIIKNFIADPIGIMGKILDPVRSHAWYTLAAQFAFLPFFSLGGLIILAPTSLSLLLNDHQFRHTLQWHYPFMLIPLWALAFTLGASNIRSWAIRAGADRFRPENAGPILALLRRLFAVLTAIYALALTWYVTIGPIDAQVLGLRILLKQSDKPFAIFIISLVGFLLLSRFSFLGKTLASRIAPVVSFYLLLVTIYLACFEGALPGRFDLERYFSKEKVEHADAAHLSLAEIPKHASLLVGQGPYTLALHNPNAFLYRGFDNYPVGDRKIDYLFFDIKTPVNEPIPQAHSRYVVNLLLLREGEYGVTSHRDGLFIFKKGVAKTKDYDLFLRHLATFPVTSLGGLTGQIDADTSSPHLVSRRTDSASSPGSQLIYGPYVKLYPGQYRAMFRLKVSQRLQEPVAFVDVVGDEGKTLFASRIINASDFTKEDQWQTFTLPFAIEHAPEKKIEFRVRYEGGAVLWCDEVKYEFSKELFTEIQEIYPSDISW